MAIGRKRLRANLACVMLAVGLALPTGFEAVRAAEQLSQDEIIKALKPPRITRGLSTPPADTARTTDDARFVETLRNRPTRSLSADERDKIATLASQKPSIDLQINFEYNSASISPKAMPQVAALGRALASAELKGSTFILAGHTDAKGGDAFNQGLSERRAEAVKRLLMEKYRLDAGSLVAAGYGESKLKNTADPNAAENRRVQVVNMADK